MNIQPLAIVACAVVAFVVSSVWYVAFSKLRATVLGFNVSEERKPKPRNILLELLRTIVLAYLFAVVLSRMRSSDLRASLELGLLLWLAFPVILLGGSVMWDKAPGKLALVHAGDWLIKLMIIAFIIGLWQ